MIQWRGETVSPKRYAAEVLALQIADQPQDWTDSRDPNMAGMTVREAGQVAEQLTAYRDRILALLAGGAA